MSSVQKQVDEVLALHRTNQQLLQDYKAGLEEQKGKTKTHHAVLEELKREKASRKATETIFLSLLDELPTERKEHFMERAKDLGINIQFRAAGSSSEQGQIAPWENFSNFFQDAVENLDRLKNRESEEKRSLDKQLEETHRWKVEVARHVRYTRHLINTLCFGWRLWYQACIFFGDSKRLGLGGSGMTLLEIKNQHDETCTRLMSLASHVEKNLDSQEYTRDQFGLRDTWDANWVIWGDALYGNTCKIEMDQKLKKEDELDNGMKRAVLESGDGLFPDFPPATR